ncbi:MAG: metal-dependent hydrolase [Elusimicrobiota bacterium]|jgi:L-ascorbate metabolism protein UlaG (beta-lactamase superfamily)
MRQLQRVTFIAGLCVIFSGTPTSPAFVPESSLRWLGHSAFQLTTRRGNVFLIDPWLANPQAPKNIQLDHVDGILLTHAHADHVGEAFDLAKKFNAPIIASNELTDIARMHGIKNVLPIDPSGSQCIADVTITAVPAVHSSGYMEGGTIIYGGAPLGFVIAEEGGRTFYDAGDTGVFSDMALISELYHPEIALLPVGGVYTMGPSEAAVATRMLAVRTIVPIHYGTFSALKGTPEQLATEMKRRGIPTSIVVMKPGQSMTLKELAAAR